MRERRDPSGIRVVESADLTGLALVDRGAYPGSTVEVRARRGQTLRQTIPAETTVSYECSGGGCKWAEFVGAALQEAISEAFDEASKVIASGGSYQSPLASAERGSVRGRMEGRDAVIDVDLPEGAEGDAVIRAHKNAGIVVRPYLDRNLSEGEIETRAGPVAGDQVMVYRKMKFRAIVVSATDAREGWPEPELIPTPEEFMERREAPGGAACGCNDHGRSTDRPHCRGGEGLERGDRASRDGDSAARPRGAGRPGCDRE